MNTLDQAVQDYLTMRRDLDFKLREAGKGLLEFAVFMRQRPVGARDQQADRRVVQNLGKPVSPFHSGAYGKGWTPGTAAPS